MKHKGLLSLVITPLLMGATPSPTSSGTIIPSSELIGPFEKYQSDKSARFLLQSTLSERVNVMARLFFYDIKTKNSKVVTSAVQTIPAKGSSSFNVTIPISKYLGPLGMEITLEVTNIVSSEKYCSYTRTIYPIGHNSIDPLDYLDNGYLIKATATRFPDRAYAERLYFPNYSDYFLTDIYYRIPFEQFDIQVGGNYTNIPLGTGQMILRDSASLFPNLKSDGSDITIPLNMEKIGENYRIILAESLYVHPKQLTMSSVPISGYVATNNFYFPVNQLYQMQGLQAHFDIYDFGNSKTNLSWDCYYDPSGSFIGACNNSQFCIVGGIG